MEPPLRTPAVWSPRHSRHAPGGGYWLGVELPGDEVPPRGEVLRAALEGAGAPVHLATAHGDAPVLRVHDAEFLDWFARAWPEWEAAGLVEASGQSRVVPTVFALPLVTSNRPIPDRRGVGAQRSVRHGHDDLDLAGDLRRGARRRRLVLAVLCGFEG